MKPRFLSHFTPSLMPPDVLEAIFVQREALVKEVLEAVRRSALTARKYNVLLVGPRGIGKTHFTSLTYYRLRAMQDLRNHLLIAWLREEEWGVTCFRDLLIRILRALPSQFPDPEKTEKRVDSIQTLPSDQIDPGALNLLRELLGSRTLVILVENLDYIFQRLGKAGQSQLHKFLNEHKISVVATSPSTFPEILTAGSQFSGFFKIHELEQLSLEDAAELVAKIARYDGNTELLNFIATPRGRVRMRALRYLAGGNHRAYIIFSQLLAQESLDDLIEPLMRAIDDLTPYYHSRIAVLAPEQRKIIEYICETRHPVRVADIARSCMLKPDAVLEHLGYLCGIGHLHAISIGHEKYYELREPLMRLSVEVKKHRGKPIGLLLDFLRLWYSPAELKQRVSRLDPDAILGRQYAVPSLQLDEKTWKDPRLSECTGEYNSAVAQKDFGRALKAAEELVAIRGQAQDFSAHAACLLQEGQVDAALAALDKWVELNPLDAAAWQLRAWALAKSGAYDQALEACDKSIELEPKQARGWCSRASILLNMGRQHEALASCDKAASLDPKNALSWTMQGTILTELGCYQESLGSFRKLLELEPQSASARAHLCAALIELKLFDKALGQAEKAAAIDPGNPVYWVLQGSALAGLQRHPEALASIERAISLGETSSFAHFKKTELLFILERWREAAECLDHALGRFAHSETPDAGNTAALIHSLSGGLYDATILELTIKVLLLVYRKHKVLSALGHGLIECIPELASPVTFTDAQARLWRACWVAMAGELPEFQLPLRFIEFAVRYRETQDLRILMDLPLEERMMLESLVGVRAQATA